MNETLAIIRGPRYGINDRGTVSLSLETYVTESSAASQGFDATEAADILEAYGVRDVSDLEGKPCWVDTSRPGLIVWSRAWRS